MRVFIVVTFFTIFSGCTGLKSYNYLTPRQLNSDPAKYNNQSVYVRGYVELGTNARNLVESESRFKKANALWERDAPADLQNEYKNDCLTLLNASFLMKNMKFFSGKTLIFKGVFVKDYMSNGRVDLQACTDTTSAFVLDESFIVNTYLKQTK